MSLRENIAACIQAADGPDDAARLICGYLYDIDLADPGNGWFSDDPEMADGLDIADGLNDAWARWKALETGRPISDFGSLGTEGA